MTINTNEFKAAHSTEPRDFGLWFFTINFFGYAKQEPRTITFTGMYSEAKAFAIKQSRPWNGVSEIVVGS